MGGLIIFIIGVAVGWLGCFFWYRPTKPLQQPAADDLQHLETVARTQIAYDPISRKYVKKRIQ